MSAPAGFEVRPAELTAQAGALAGPLQQLRGAHDALPATELPSTVFGRSAAAATAADANKTIVEAGLAAVQQHQQRLGVVQKALTDCATGYTTADEKVAASYRSILTGLGVDEKTLASLPGASAGSGPFAAAIAGNRAKVADALTAEKKNLADLQEQLAQQKQRLGDPWQADSGLGTATSIHDLDGRIADAQKRVDLYTDILDHDRKIVQFDPSGNGRIVELMGDVDASTKNVGVLVPGTNTSLANYASYATLARSWVDSDPNHSLAMLVYADGRNPQNVLTQSPFPSYAHTMAPDLAAFSHQVRTESTAAAGHGIDITYVPHSYAASTVGAAEKLGLDTDRIVDVEGAGVGPGVWQPSDLPDYDHVQRYSMTAPHDPIALVQGRTDLGPVTVSSPHGADPDTFGGTTRLDPGRVPHNGWLGPFDAGQHTAVLKPYSDASWNIFSVLTGSTPKTLQ